MPRCLSATAAMLPLEEYAAQFDDLFARQSQREGFRRDLAGRLPPAERNKAAAGLANTAPRGGWRCCASIAIMSQDGPSRPPAA